MIPPFFLWVRGSRSVFFSLGISLFLCLPVSGQEVLIGMNDVEQPGGPDELVGIDLPSGVASHLHFFSRGMNFLESLAYDNRENVLWTTNDGILYRIDFRINSATFDAVRVGDTGKSDIDGLSVQPSTGLLFGVTHAGNDLLLIDKTDAGTSVINTSVEVGSRLEDLTFDPAGRLFILTSNSLVEVDPTDGSRLFKVRLNGGTSLEGLIWWKEGGVFLSAADRGRYKDLVSIDLAGNVAFLSNENSGFRDIEALALVPRDSEVEVPVALQAESIFRDASGVQLAWWAQEAVSAFYVQRALHSAGPWESVGELRPTMIGHASSEAFLFTDTEAAYLLQDVDLFYRVGPGRQLDLGVFPAGGSARAAERHASREHAESLQSTHNLPCRIGTAADGVFAGVRYPWPARAPANAAVGCRLAWPPLGWRGSTRQPSVFGDLPLCPAGWPTTTPRTSRADQVTTKGCRSRRRPRPGGARFVSPEIENGCRL